MGAKTSLTKQSIGYLCKNHQKDQLFFSKRHPRKFFLLLFTQLRMLQMLRCNPEETCNQNKSTHTVRSETKITGSEIWFERT